MSRKIRENFLVGYGNQGLYPAGQPVYSTNNTTGMPPTVLVKPGQFVFYDPVTLLSINTATWTKSTNGRFVLGVGVDEKGEGYATSIRKCFGEMFYGCNIQSINTGCGSCGLPQIQDVFVKGCVDTDSPVSIRFTAIDLDSVYEYRHLEGPSWTYTVNIPSKLCGPCEDEEATGEQLVNELWKQIRPQLSRPNRLTSLRVGTFPKNAHQEIPFDIVPLYSTSYNYELVAVNGDCKTCIGVESLTSISIGGETKTFNTASATSINGTSVSTHGQLQLIVNQINVWLNGKGAAVIKKSTGCCDYAIEINTCLTMGNIVTSGEDPIAPEVTNPFTTVTETVDSYICGTSTSSFTPTAGFRVITKPIMLKDDCLLNLSLTKFLTRSVRISSAHPYQENYPFFVVETQKNTIPTGLGASWAIREYKSDNGGTGRNHNMYDGKHGYWGMPSRKDRVNAGMVDPTENYSSVIIDHSYVNSPQHHISYMNQLYGTTILLIPSADETTKTAIETAFNNYITDGYCNALSEIELC